MRWVYTMICFVILLYNIYGIAITSGVVYLTSRELNSTVIINGTLQNLSMKEWGRYSIINTEGTTIYVVMKPSDNIKDFVCLVPYNATLPPNYHIGVDVYYANDSRCLNRTEGILNITGVIEGYIDNEIGVANRSGGVSIMLNLRKIVQIESPHYSKNSTVIHEENYTNTNETESKVVGNTIDLNTCYVITITILLLSVVIWRWRE